MLLKELRSTIQDIGFDVYRYSHPSELARTAEKHRDDVILSIYGGIASRNRMALTPAICETMDLRFIGPDTYGRVIAQDKEVSRAVSVHSGS